MPEPNPLDEPGLPIVVVGTRDGHTDVVVGPYTYVEDADAFLRHAIATGPDAIAYRVIRVMHPVQWEQANRRRIQGGMTGNPE